MLILDGRRCGELKPCIAGNDDCKSFGVGRRDAIKEEERA